MYILIDKKTNQIRSINDGEIKYDTNLFELKEVPDEEYIGYTMYYKDGKIEKTKTHSPHDSESIREELQGATTMDELKNIISKLIT